MADETDTTSTDAGLRAALQNSVDQTVSNSAGDDPEALKAQVEKWKAMSRKNEAEAKANAAAAKRLAEIEEANKTEAQKAADQAAAALAEAATAKAALLRYQVATAKGVPAELLTATTQADLEAQADALLSFAGKQGQVPPATDIGQGNRGPSGTPDPNQWLRNAVKTDRKSIYG